MHLSVPSGISHLCQELIDEITDYFQIFRLPEDDCWARQDAVYLCTCALISRVFRLRSQKHLFAFIGLYVTDSNAAQFTFGKLNDVFSTNPQLASHVKILTLRIRETADLWSPSFVYPDFVACLAHMSQSGNRYPWRV